MTAIASGRKTMRVAAYTRKSTTKGLDKELSTLDAQREACEAYVKTQRAAGWELLAARYDDGGFTGSNTDRPAFQRLMRDVEAGRIDVIVAYKLDRLSRSQFDLLQTLRTLEQHGVAFASATEPISTASPTGRMMVGVLSSFAELQRETIVERTRDKAAAEKRAGLWVGGRCALGYNVVKRRLVINAGEAKQVREIFRLYLELGSIHPVVAELERRCWRNKRLVTQAGKVLGDHPFGKHSLHGILTNPTYIGAVRIADELHHGLHEAIIEKATWDAVQAQLARNNAAPPNALRTRWSAPLKGLIRCAKCSAAYTHHVTTRRGRKHRYYVCLTYRRRGARSCSGSIVPADEMDAFVVDRIRSIGQNAQLIAEVAAAARNELLVRLPEIEVELATLRRDGAGLKTEQSNLLDILARTGSSAESVLPRLQGIEGQLRKLEERVRELDAEARGLRDQVVDAEDLRAAVAGFDRVWDALTVQERGRILELLIEAVTYNADSAELEIRFRAGGIKLLAQQKESR